MRTHFAKSLKTLKKRTLAGGLVLDRPCIWISPAQDQFPLCESLGGFHYWPWCNDRKIGSRAGRGQMDYAIKRRRSTRIVINSLVR